MHCIILILTYLSARPRPRGAEIKNSSRAILKGVQWSTSAKCEDTNISFGSRQAPVHPTNHPYLFFESL
jgi:hypothetical protein